MEDNNISHNVANYFSYDAPHQGAYAPIGLQHLLKSASYAVRDIRVNPNVATLLSKLNSVAGKQLLQFNDSDISNERNTFAAVYAAKGYPALCNNYGIANGRGDGVGANYSGGDQLMEMNGFAKVWLLGKVLKHKQQLFSLSSTLSTISYLSNTGLAPFLGLNGLKSFSSKKMGSAEHSWEAVPGSTLSMHTEYGVGLSKGFEEIGGSSIDFFGRHETAFVATASALDLNNQNYGTNNVYLPRNPYYNIEANHNNVLSSHITPFKDIIYSSSYSQSHLDIDYRISNFIFTKIYGDNIPYSCQTSCNNIPTFTAIIQDCSNGEKRITMKNSPNGVAIKWVSNDLSIVSGQGTKSITFISNSNGPFSGHVELTPPGCPTMNFPFSVIIEPAVISGPTTICGEGTYSVSNLPIGATVTWEINEAFTEIIASNTNEITLSTVGYEGGVFIIKAIISTSCGNYELQTTITSGIPYSVTAEVYCEDGCGFENQLCVDDRPYAEFNNIITYQVNETPIFPLTLHYKFSPDSGYGFYTGSKLLTSTSGYIILPRSFEPGFYGINVWVTGGPCNAASEPWEIGIMAVNCNNSRIVAYPNPATTEIKVGFRDLSANRFKAAASAAATRLFNVKLLDQKGRIQKAAKNIQGQDQISLDVADLPAGTYYLHILEGKSIDKQQIIINR
ncbi:T9SS type A sorting domain-containing protein [Pedobacter sp. ASV1-7]|uniref:T9SS type A sorting domain-containing protein n=1 Tax=Pedobacter sp. ASV1-7 TaxID=3145237 RepID=UPI0032E8B521